LFTPKGRLISGRMHILSLKSTFSFKCEDQAIYMYEFDTIK